MESNKEILKRTYAAALKAARESNHSDYSWPLEMLPTVTARMLDAIDEKSFNKDSTAWKATCKALGIPHTYKAIYAFMEGGAANG